MEEITSKERFGNKEKEEKKSYLAPVAINKLQLFKGCWRENHREYSSEIWYLHVSEHAQIKYAEKENRHFHPIDGAVPYFNSYRQQIQLPKLIDRA
ncbi:hypothetical protein TNCV_3148491 [Trichonephila clavipes]|nr:hypothetical protein TNCV_3148491 [Trichonephila clavipes]